MLRTAGLPGKKRLNNRPVLAFANRLFYFKDLPLYAFINS
jgi:hypothetical protein